MVQSDTRHEPWADDSADERSTDNEQGIASGWLPGRLSEQGKAQAEELGRRRRDDRIPAVFSSDLGRAIETSTIAFARSDVPLLYDWRLRECDYGLLSGTSAAELRSSSMSYLDRPYPRRLAGVAPGRARLAGGND